MKKTLSLEKQEFLAYLDAHRDELRRRLTELTPPKLRYSMRGVIADIVKKSTASRYFWVSDNVYLDHEKYHKVAKKIRQIKQAWFGVVRVNWKHQARVFHQIVANFTLE